MYKFFTLIVFLSTFMLSHAVSVQEVEAMPKANSSAEGQAISGKVIESINAAGYTYLLVATNGSENWVAIPETEVKKGSTVSYYSGMIMRDFTSKSLNRTFATITFSPGLADTGPTAEKPATNDSFSAAIAKEQTRPGPAPISEVSGGSTGAIVPFNEINVEKSSSSNGYTVEEIFIKAKELNGKNIQVRGKVVKFSPMIMGRNWVHIQDGSGDPMKNTHDLVITTQESLEIGQISILEGTLAAKKDFGAGYKYPVIIEKATIIK